VDRLRRHYAGTSSQRRFVLVGPQRLPHPGCGPARYGTTALGTQWDTLRAELQRINQTKARADLSPEITKQDAHALNVIARGMVPEAALRPQAKMYVELYENRLTSAVTAGENAGYTLRHDYVARQWIGPLDVDAQGVVRLQRTLPLNRDWKTPDLGLAVFIQQQTGDVLQALAMPLGQ